MKVKHKDLPLYCPVERAPDFRWPMQGIFHKCCVNSIKLGTVEFCINATTTWNGFKMYGTFEFQSDA